MAASVPSPARMRRLMPWILWSMGGFSVLGAAFVVLWIWLPLWAPEWVIRYSPWVDPVLRAMACDVADRSRPVQWIDAFEQRITAWGSPARPEVVAGLGSSDPSLRRACVWALTDIHESRSPHPEFIQDKLFVLALSDENDLVRNYAYFALTPERSPRMSKVRARAMKDGEDWVRSAVVAELDSRTSDLDLQTLLSALHDPDWDVRLLAVKRVEELNEVRAVKHLIGIAQWDNDPAVFSAILSALGHFRSFEAIPVLKEQLVGLHSDDASELLKTITVIDAAEGFRLRLKILQGPNVGLRAFAALELGESADQNAIEPLTTQLQDPKPLVMGHVMIALCRLKAVSAVELILDQLEARGAELITFDRGQEELPNPIVSGRLMKVYFSEVVDQVAMMPLSPAQRERLDRLREE